MWNAISYFQEKKTEFQVSEKKLFTKLFTRRRKCENIKCKRRNFYRNLSHLEQSHQGDYDRLDK
jgi:hypothetical protein